MHYELEHIRTGGAKWEPFGYVTFNYLVPCYFGTIEEARAVIARSRRKDWRIVRVTDDGKREVMS